MSQLEVRYLGGGAREQVTTFPDGTQQIDEYSYGKLTTSTLEESGSSTQISSVTYGYDALGRVSYETDARNGATYYTYTSYPSRLSIGWTGHSLTFELSGKGVIT